MSVEAKEFKWAQMDFGKGPLPSPRVYHSSTVLRTSKTVQMVLLFGGRNAKNQVIVLIWGVVGKLFVCLVLLFLIVRR